MDGHFGHHDMAFDAEKRFGFFTNPGDGTISVLSLKTLEVVTTLTLVARQRPSWLLGVAKPTID